MATFEKRHNRSTTLPRDEQCAPELVGRIGVSEGEVLTDGRREEERILGDHADLAAQQFIDAGESVASHDAFPGGR